MAARFPQSGSSVAYKIKAAYASKIKAVYWAASADSVHALHAGDTATTIVTRSATGAGFNADGRITGTNNAVFSDPHSFGLNEQSDIVFGCFAYGDIFNGMGSDVATLIASQSPPDNYHNGFKLSASEYSIGARLKGGAGSSAVTAGQANNVPAFFDIAVRRAAADPINTFRVWVNGSESTGDRVNAAASAGPDAITTLYFGGSFTGTGNTSIQWEGCFFASGDLTDAELDAITADPTVLIEESPAGETITLTPDPASVQVGGTRTFTATRSAPAGAGGVTYNLTSSDTGKATVPATATILEGNSSITFNATGVAVGSTTITATNAADSGETDSVTLTVALTKKLKLLVHPDAQGDTGVAGVVFAAPAGSDITGAKIGEFTGKTFEASLESGKAVLKVPVADFGGSALTTSDTPVALVRNATNTTGIISCTVIEE